MVLSSRASNIHESSNSYSKWKFSKQMADFSILAFMYSIALTIGRKLFGEKKISAHRLERNQILRPISTPQKQLRPIKILLCVYDCMNAFGSYSVYADDELYCAGTEKEGAKTARPEGNEQHSNLLVMFSNANKFLCQSEGMQGESILIFLGEGGPRCSLPRSSRGIGRKDLLIQICRYLVPDFLMRWK